MQKNAYALTLLLLLFPLTGCIGADNETEVEISLACNELDFTTHEVTTSYPEHEFETWIETNTIRDGIYIQNSDLSYFEEATQVLLNEQIFNLTPYKSPVYDTHTKIGVGWIYSADGTGEGIDYNIGDVICLIENPEIVLIHDGRGDSRVCKNTILRLENGNYEHHIPDCNYVLTENLDRTSTIRGSVEFPSNSVSPEDCDSLSFFNSFNSSIVGVNLSVAGSWGHFGGGNEFRVHYNGIESNYVKSYFINAQEQDRYPLTQEASIRSVGIHVDDLLRDCNIAGVELYADENLTDPASLDRNLTTADTWEVIAEECTFNRPNARLGESQLMFYHGCSNSYLGVSQSFCEDNPDICETWANEIQPESSHMYYSNFTQAIINQNYSMWHAMLADQVHSINSDEVYEKQNLTDEFFENFTNKVGAIDLDNASRLDLAQNHWQLRYSPYTNSTFNWSFVPVYGNLEWGVVSPIAESVLLQDRIYNDTGWGYGGIFVPSTTYEIHTWVMGPNTTPLLSEYLLTVVLERDGNGTLSIVGIADYTVVIPR
jgi:hypothetical protein